MLMITTLYVFTTTIFVLGQPKNVIGAKITASYLTTCGLFQLDQLFFFLSARYLHLINARSGVINAVLSRRSRDTRSADFLSVLSRNKAVGRYRQLYKRQATFLKYYGEIRSPSVSTLDSINAPADYTSARILPEIFDIFVCVVSQCIFSRTRGEYCSFFSCKFFSISAFMCIHCM